MPDHYTEQYYLPKRHGAPPCPVVSKLHLANPDTGREKITTAIIDTAADVTCLPWSYIEYLDLEPSGPGVMVNKQPQLTFLLTIGYQDLVRDDFDVTYLPESLESYEDEEQEEEDALLLGRDVLNRLHILLRPKHGERGEFDVMNP